MAIQKLRKFPAIVIFSYFIKDNAFTAVKRMQCIKLGMWKGCNLSLEGI